MMRISVPSPMYMGVLPSGQRFGYPNSRVSKPLFATGDGFVEAKLWV